MCRRHEPLLVSFSANSKERPFVSLEDLNGYRICSVRYFDGNALVSEEIPLNFLGFATIGRGSGGVSLNRLWTGFISE